MTEFYEKLNELISHNVKCAVCTVVSTSGSAPRKTGAKMIVTSELKIYGTIGGGILEKNIIDRCPEIIRKSQPELIKLNLSKDLGMKCGGSVDVFIEPVSSPFNLYIFGGGHIGRALSELASNLNFTVTLIDDREEIRKEHFANNVDVIIENYDSFIDHLSIDKNTFIAIVTKGHETDLAVLKKCIKSDSTYIGVIGSQKKSIELKKDIISGGYGNEDDFNRIHIPVGLPIMAEGPYEIAVSIASELILVKNKILNDINNEKG